MFKPVLYHASRSSIHPCRNPLPIHRRRRRCPSKYQTVLHFWIFAMVTHMNIITKYGSTIMDVDQVKEGIAIAPEVYYTTHNELEKNNATINNSNSVENNKKARKKSLPHHLVTNDIYSSNTSVINSSSSPYDPAILPKSSNNIFQKSNNNTNKTLALLYPSGLIGGYRNQVLRLYALVVHAKKHNFSQLLLPSILFTTDYNTTDDDDRDTRIANWRPIPMDLLFDVDHWNRYSRYLPTLVNSIENSDCWPTSPSSLSFYSSASLSGHNDHRNNNESNNNNSTTIHEHYGDKITSSWSQTVLKQLQFLTPIANTSYKFANGERSSSHLSQVDYMPRVENCTNPSVYGGGPKAGRLWNDSVKYGKKAELRQLVERWYLQALRPKLQWRQLAMKCVHQGIQQQQQDGDGNNDYNNNNINNNYVALHARVELNMMTHICGSTMERNLTKILHMVGQWVHNNTTTTEHGNGEYDMRNKIRGVFMAISRSGMKLPKRIGKGADHQMVYELARDNMQTLNRVVGNGIIGSGLQSPSTGLNIGKSNQNLPIFECGAPWMNRYYTKINPSSMDYGSLLEAIVNFYAATEAAVFIGVRGSSFSNQIWTTRYHQGKGASNFEYTQKHGIRPIENGGLPPAHYNCKEMIRKEKTKNTDVRIERV